MRGGSGIRDGPPVSPVETDMMVLQEDLRLSSDSEVGPDVPGDEPVGCWGVCLGVNKGPTVWGLICAGERG